jgi:hypothetical protein
LNDIHVKDLINHSGQYTRLRICKERGTTHEGVDPTYLGYGKIIEVLVVCPLGIGMVVED